MATFPSVTPGYTFTETDQYRILVNNIWGKERRRNKWNDSKKVFSLRFDHIAKGDADYIHDFFIARKGNYEKFDWTHPVTSVTYSVRFVTGSLKREEVGPNAFNVELELLEVL